MFEITVLINRKKLLFMFSLLDWNLPLVTMLKRCVKKLLEDAYMHRHMLLISTRFKECSKMLLMIVHCCWEIFLIGVLHLKCLWSFIIIILILMTFISFLPGVTNIINAKHIKRDIKRFNSYSIASIRLFGLVYSWGWKKRNKKVVE